MIALIAAVALAGIAPSARDCLALAVYTEARGEPVLGQILVAKVVVNRAVRDGAGICDVITSPGQFHGVTGSFRRLKDTNKEWQLARLIADVVIERLWDVHSFCGVPYYFNQGTRGHGAALCTVGRHTFYG